MESDAIKNLIKCEEQVNIKVSQAMKEKTERLKSIKHESEEELALFRKTQTDRLESQIIQMQSELKSKSDSKSQNEKEQTKENGKISEEYEMNK